MSSSPAYPKPILNQALLSALSGANSILLCTHLRPDGDAVGSVTAAAQVLRGMGKSVVMICEDAVPAKYAFLPLADEILPPARAQGAFDLALALDAAEEARLGACAGLFHACPVTAQIDHHPTNPGYAQINEIDGAASSAGAMVWRMIAALGAPVTPGIAACLYAAVSSDTGNFCFRNTDAEAFACAAAMMDAGLQLGEAAQKVHLSLEAPHVRLLGRAIASLRVFAGGRAAGMTLTKEDYAACGACEEHTDKIVNYAKNIAGVAMAYLADDHLGYVKFSLRAEPPFDVAAVAQRYRGGGHVLAAGCRMPLPLDAARDAMEREFLAQLGER